MAKLLATGLGAKFWGTERNKGATTLISAGNLISTVPLSILVYAMNYEDFEKIGFPDVDGECFAMGKPILHNYFLISEFEAQYREYAKGFKQYSSSDPHQLDVSLPIPMPNWRSTYNNYELQRYLNYYNYRYWSTRWYLWCKNQKSTESVLERKC